MEYPSAFKPTLIPTRFIWSVPTPIPSENRIPKTLSVILWGGGNEVSSVLMPALETRKQTLESFVKLTISCAARLRRMIARSELRKLVLLCCFGIWCAMAMTPHSALANLEATLVYPFKHTVYAQAMNSNKNGDRATDIEHVPKEQNQNEQAEAEVLDCEALFKEYLEKFGQMVQFYSELNIDIQGGYSGSRGDVWGFQRKVIRDAFIVRYCNPAYVSCSKAALDEYLQCLTNCNDKWVHKKPRTHQDRRDGKDERNRCFQEANRKVNQCIELYKQPRTLAEKPPGGEPSVEKPSIDMPFAKAEEDSLFRDLRWFFEITKTATEALQASALAKTKASMQRIAAKKIRMRIGQLQNILDRAREGDQKVFETVLDPFNPVWQAFWDGSPPKADSTEAARKALEDKVDELWKIYRDIEKDQDESISNILPTYDHIIKELQLVGGRSKHEIIRNAAKALREEMAWERDKDRLELPLSAGRSEKVHAVAQEYISQGKYEPLARYCQGLNLLEQGRPRLALQALRVSLETNKKLRETSNVDPRSVLSLGEVGLLEKQIQRTEVAYLECMNRAMMGQAKEVYRKCMVALYRVAEPGFYDYEGYIPASAEIEWLQQVKDAFNIGLFSQILAVRDDTPGGQADLMGEITWEAAVDHGGLLLITRLRQKGMTLDEIRNLSHEGLVAAFKKHFGENSIEKAKLDRRDLLRMRQTMMAAFRHPDVERLWAGSTSGTDLEKALGTLEIEHQDAWVSDKEYEWRRSQLEKRLHALKQGRQQFDLDVDRPYFDVDKAESHFQGGAFEYHWLQYMGDIINCKNLLLMLGPSTAVTVDGNLAWGLSSSYTTKQLETAITFKHLFARLVRVPQIADALYRSPHGARVADALLKVAAPTGTGVTGALARGGSAAARLTASIIAMMGIVQSSSMAGEAIGGTLDQVFGDEEGTREGQVIGSAIGELLGSVLVSLGAGDVNEAVKVLKEAGVRHEHLPALVRALQDLSLQADDIAVNNSKLMKSIKQALHEVESGGLSSGGRQVLDKAIGQIDDDLAPLMRQVAGGKASIDQIEHAYRLQTFKKVCKALRAGKRPDAEWMRALTDEIKEQVDARLNQVQTRKKICEAIESSFPKPGGETTARGSARPGQLAVSNPSLEGSQPLTGSGLADLEKAKLGEFPLLKSGDSLLFKGEYGKAVQRYKELLTFVKEMGQEGCPEGVQLAKNLRIAKRSWLAYQRLSDADPALTESIMKRFRPGEAEAIAQRASGPNATVQLVPIEEATYQKPFWVYENNRKIGVFKPGHLAHAGKDIKAELMYYKLAHRLGYKCPACAPITMQTPDGVKRGVLVRYINGSQLKKCDVGWRMAARKVIARDKVLSLLLGDHDRHFGNYLVSNEAGVFGIDHGMADYDDFLALTEFRNYTTRQLMMQRIQFARNRHEQMAFMEKFILYDDLQQAVGDIKAIEGEIETLLKPVFDDANELEAVTELIKTRLRLLPEVIDEGYGSITIRKLSQHRPTAQAMPLANFWPSRQLQQVEALPLAA